MKNKTRHQNVFEGNQVVLLVSGIRTREMGLWTKAELRLTVATQLLMEEHYSEEFSFSS